MQSHTILGSKTQRGLTQMALDILFQSTDTQLVQPTYGSSVFPSLAAADVSEAQLFPAATFLDSLYGDNQSERGFNSRAQTPMPVCPSFHKQIWTYIPTPTKPNLTYPTLPPLTPTLPLAKIYTVALVQGCPHLKKSTLTPNQVSSP